MSIQLYIDITELLQILEESWGFANKGMSINGLLSIAEVVHERKLYKVKRGEYEQTRLS